MLEKPHSLSLTEHTARTLRKAILRGELTPGSRVVEQSIAELMGISRGPVREAIQQLASEGLLVIQPRRGAVVCTLDPHTAWEVQTLRGTLEAFAAELGFSRVRPEGLEYLESIITKMTECSQSNDLQGFADADLAFHGYIVRLSGHARLISTFATLDPLLASICYTVVQELGVPLSSAPPRHQRIVDAFRSGDIHHTMDVLKAHYNVQAEKFLALCKD